MPLLRLAILVLSLLFAITPLLAQLQRGGHLLPGGSSSLASANYVALGSQRVNYQSLGAALGTTYLRFVTDRLAVGGTLGGGFFTDLNVEGTTRTTFLEMAPAARYFFGSTSAAWRPYASASAYIEQARTSWPPETFAPGPIGQRQTFRTTEFGATLGAGVVRQLAPSTALQIEANARLPFGQRTGGNLIDNAGRRFELPPARPAIALTVRPVASIGPGLKESERDNVFGRGRWLIGGRGLRLSANDIDDASTRYFAASISASAYAAVSGHWAVGADLFLSGREGFDPTFSIAPGARYYLTPDARRSLLVQLNATAQHRVGLLSSTWGFGAELTPAMAFALAPGAALELGVTGGFRQNTGAVRTIDDTRLSVAARAGLQLSLGKLNEEQL